MSVLSWHGPLSGVSRNSISTLSHRSEVTETCPGRENQRILLTYEAILVQIRVQDYAYELLPIQESRNLPASLMAHCEFPPTLQFYQAQYQFLRFAHFQGGSEETVQSLV